VSTSLVMSPPIGQSFELLTICGATASYRLKEMRRFGRAA
jgi:hypothetical protein